MNLEINPWTVLGIVAAILLVIYWRDRNAVWGGLTIGVVIGFLIELFAVFRGDGFDWSVIGKGAVIGTIAGFGAELLGKVSDLIKRRQ